MGFRLAYLNVIFASSKGQLGSRNGVFIAKENILTFLLDNAERLCTMGHGNLTAENHALQDHATLLSNILQQKYTN